MRSSNQFYNFKSKFDDQEESEHSGFQTLKRSSNIVGSNPEKIIQDCWLITHLADKSSSLFNDCSPVRELFNLKTKSTQFVSTAGSRGAVNPILKIAVLVWIKIHEPDQIRLFSFNCTQLILSALCFSTYARPNFCSFKMRCTTFLD